MTQYIDKTALVAEIERLEGFNNCGTSDFIEAKRIAFEQIKQVLDTLEVKEADMNASIKQKQLIDKACERLESFLYDKLNSGELECGDIEKLIKDGKTALVENNK